MKQHLRILVGAAAITLALAVVVLAPAQREPAARASAHQSDVMVLYIGAEDCAPCRSWQYGAGLTFRTSAEFARLTYREIKSPDLFDVLRDENWPADLRDYRNHLGENAGVPMWLVISDQFVVAEGFGASQWHEVVLPKIKSLLR